MKKSFVCLLLALLLVFSGCGAPTPDYEDTNGEDTSLQYLTEKDLLLGNKSLSTLSVSSTINDMHELSIDTFNGVKTLETISGKHTITLTCSLRKGNARLVLCTKNAVLYEFDLNDENQQYTLDGTQGRVFLKLAGEDCGIKLQYTID